MASAIDTKTRIIEAAERLFADSSFDAVAVRDIMKEAQANLGLMKYYFESKEALVEEVIARRAGILNAERLQRLNRFAGTPESSIKRVIDAIVDPYFEMMMQPEPGWHSYGRLIAQMAQSKRWNDLIHKYFDEISGKLIDELERLTPHTSRDDVTRFFLFAIGAQLNFFSINGRLRSLTNGAISDEDLEGGVEHLKRFLVSGLTGSLSS